MWDYKLRRESRCSMDRWNQNFINTLYTKEAKKYKPEDPK